MTAQPDPYNPPPRRFAPGDTTLDAAHYREVVLDRVKVASRGHITREALADRAEVSLMLDMVTDSLIVNLESFVLGHDRKTVRWQLVEYRPASWWEYLKRRHAPRWFLDRYPVKHQRHERTLSLPLRSLYPEAPAPPGLGPVVFHTMDPPAFSMEQQ